MGVIDFISSLVMTIIEALACDLFFQTFMKERFPKKPWVRMIILILLTVLWVITSVNMSIFWIKAIICTSIVVMLMLILYKASVWRVLFGAICYEGINWGMDLILMAIYQFFVDETATEMIQKEGKITLLWVLFKLVMFLVIVGINRTFSKRDYQMLRDNEWVRFLFLPIFTIVAMLFMVVDEKMGRMTMFVLSTGLVVANVILFYLIRDFAKREEAEHMAKLQQEQRNGQIEIYENMERYYNQQRKSVHEFKNHMGCIQGLLQEGREKEALEYIRKVNHSSEQYISSFATQNPVVDVVMNQKYQQARLAGINVVAVMNDLKGIPMAEEDLVVLLSNLLNNAIEACGRLKKKRREIKFKFVQKQEKVVLSIKNPIEKRLIKVNNQIKTTKRNEKEHGIGLGNVAKIIEKYGGEEMYSDEGGEFSYVIVFSREEMKMKYEEIQARS